MDKYDFAVVGNGAIGTFTAIKLKQSFPEMSVALIGNAHHADSASIAAGAMIAVYAEMEECSAEQIDTQRRYLKIGKDSSAGWLDFLSKSGGLEAITAKDTLVFLKTDHSKFELANFNTVKKALDQDGRGVKPANLAWLEERQNIQEVFRIDGEFAVCPIALFKHFTKLMKDLGVQVIPDDVSDLNLDANIITLENSDIKIEFSKLVVAAGAQTGNILKGDPILPMLQGVGTAITIDNNADTEGFSNHVVRTVNRGGAQCGIHVVPRSDGTIYLGAGNYVSRPGPAAHRLDTVSYLLSTLERDLLNRTVVYKFTGDFLIGMRPRSIDGFPIIGAMSVFENVFVATGTNRLGLTWAPRIADQVVAWANESKLDAEFLGWEPNRFPLTYGTVENAINYYVESRISNACEHGLSGSTLHELNEMNIHFTKVAESLLTNIQNKFPKYRDIVLHPDNWAALLTN